MHRGSESFDSKRKRTTYGNIRTTSSLRSAGQILILTSCPMRSWYRYARENHLGMGGSRSAPRCLQRKQEGLRMRRIGALKSLLVLFWVSLVKVEAFSTISLPSFHRALRDPHSFRDSPRHLQVLTTKGAGDDEVGHVIRLAQKKQQHLILLPLILIIVGS